MTTLDNGTVIDETRTAVNYTPAADCPATYGGRQRIVKGVTVHHWGVDGQNFAAVRDDLAGPNARGVSAHFVLQDGEVACLINPDDVAWHAGNPDGNAYTIGIECRPEMTSGDLATLASLIRYLQTIYGDLQVYTHNMWYNTQCAGRYNSQVGTIVNMVNHPTPTPTPTPAPAPAPAPVPVAPAETPEQEILRIARYVESPLFKVHIFTGQSPEEITAREQFIAEIVKAVKQ